MAPDQNSSGVAQAVQEVSEKAQLLIREEIALAKAELTDKVTKLVKGIVVGLVAGIFALLALLYLLDSLAWGVWALWGGENGTIWLGFLIVAVLLLVLGAIAGFVAAKFVKRGTPPTPKMAIEEAQLIKQTISSSSAPAKAPTTTKTPEVRR